MTSLDQLHHWNLTEYLKQLASQSAAPGGGAAAALTAAQSASLLAMVLNVTHGPTPNALRESLDQCRQELLHLAEQDGHAFGQVAKAYGMAKETADDQARRRQAIQAGLKGATQVPLQVMDQCAGLLGTARQVIDQGKPTVITDAAIGVVLAAAGLRSAHYNVLINLKYLKDADYKQEAQAKAHTSLAALTSEPELLAAIGQRLSS